MKNQLLDIKAALLLLFIYQYGENRLAYTPQQRALALIWLEENNYIPSWKTLILFDNDGIPQIKWKNENFNPEEIYTAVNWDPFYMDSSYLPIIR